MSFQTNGQESLLHHNGATEGPYELPIYLQGNATIVRVAMTPIAMIGDTVMVGLVAGVVAAYAYARGKWRQIDLETEVVECGESPGGEEEQIAPTAACNQVCIVPYFAASA